jgi:hypothetical protein
MRLDQAKAPMNAHAFQAGCPFGGLVFGYALVAAGAARRRQSHRRRAEHAEMAGAAASEGAGQ